MHLGQPDPPSARQSLVSMWERFWFANVPSESVAVVRIAVGVAGLVNLIGFTPVEMYWLPDGITPLPGEATGFRSQLLTSGLGAGAGVALLLTLCAAFVCMTIGLLTNSFVLICFVGSLLQVHWNPLPMTSGQGVLLAALFCLVWADCGARLSIDERRRPRSDIDEGAFQPIWPLRLLRAQVGLIYATSGFFKLLGSAWRDGSAVYYTTAQNIFGRIFHVYPFPTDLNWVLTALTYATLLWELSFPLLLLNRFTRRVALITGVGMHLGIWATMEVGPFTWMILATYVAFLDPPSVQRAVARWRFGTRRQPEIVLASAELPSSGPIPPS